MLPPLPLSCDGFFLKDELYHIITVRNIFVTKFMKDTKKRHSKKINTPNIETPQLPKDVSNLGINSDFVSDSMLRTIEALYTKKEDSSQNIRSNDYTMGEVGLLSAWECQFHLDLQKDLYCTTPYSPNPKTSTEAKVGTGEKTSETKQIPETSPAQSQNPPQPATTSSNTADLLKRLQDIANGGTGGITRS